MGLTWNEQLSVGNAVIDSEHKNLISMVKNVRIAIRSRDSITLSQTFWQLEHWLCVHYANEERIARSVNFDFSGHKRDRQYEMRELRHLRDELVAKGGVWCEAEVEHYSNFLGGWIIDGHIIEQNMLMKPALQTYDYAFWPDWQEGANHAAVHTANLYLQFQT